MKRYPDPAEIEQLKQQWTNKQVKVDTSRPELRRFAGLVGTVITVNMNGKCLVNFQEGWGRYDIDPAYLIPVGEETDPESAQASPSG